MSSVSVRPESPSGGIHTPRPGRCQIGPAKGSALDIPLTHERVSGTDLGWLANLFLARSARVASPSEVRAEPELSSAARTQGAIAQHLRELADRALQGERPADGLRVVAAQGAERLPD